MELSYFHSAEDVPDGYVPETSVVIDVLRATTTIACALNNGAEGVQTFDNIERLKETASLWPSSKRLLLGERGGKKIEGFDLGNSPVAVTKDLVEKKRLFMSTTNGTRALQRVKDSRNLYTMSLINRKAVAEQLLSLRSTEILILGSGWEGAYSLEDSLAAGALASFLLESNSQSVSILNDELSAALALWACFKNNIQTCLRSSTHGQRLERIGNHDDDFNCCSELDKINVVPSQSEEPLLFSL